MKITKFIIASVLLVITIGANIAFDIAKISVGCSVCSFAISFAAGWFIKCFYDLFYVGWRSSLYNRLISKDIRKDDNIRISFSYLFRIKIKGKYFLIKNIRMDHFHAVGGCYKMQKSEFDYLKDKYSVSISQQVPFDEENGVDYRLNVPACNLTRFVRRFNKTKDREQISNLTREFKEELIEPSYIDKSNFNEISYRYCGRHYDGINYSHFLNCYELLIADIVELQLTQSQENELLQLAQNDKDMFILADGKIIMSEGVDPENNKFKRYIANNAYKILDVKEIKLVKKATENHEYTNVKVL